MAVRSEFDRYADEYDATVQAAIGASGETVEFFADLKARLARAEAPDARRILDFGCGVGNLCRALARRFPDAHLAGCDPSSDSINTARARTGGGIEYAVNDERIPFPDASFDLVVAACVFHHIGAGEQERWLREIARVLRPGGRLVFFEHNPLNPLTRRVVRNVPFDAGVVLLGRGASARLVHSAGLRVSRARYYFFFPRLLSAFRVLERLMGWIPLGAQYYVTGVRP
ncbi:MAG TPA: class I SAM-dependent methyltransferase [Gemmatimonadaceae bacterium]